MNKSLMIFLIIVLVSLTGLVSVLNDNGITGDFLRRSRSRSYRPSYNYPTQTQTIQSTQPSQQAQPQVNLYQWAGHFIPNYVKQQTDREKCSNSCKNLMKASCTGQFPQLKTQCEDIATKYENVCKSQCNREHTAKVNPDQWANSFIQRYVSTQRDLTFCKNNCFQSIQGNCMGQKVLGTSTECSSLAARYIQGCQGACQIKLSEQSQQVQAKPVDVQPEKPIQIQPVQQVQAQPIQTPVQEYAECSKKCLQSKTKILRDCFNQNNSKTLQEKQQICNPIAQKIYTNCMMHQTTGCYSIYRKQISGGQ